MSCMCVWCVCVGGGGGAITRETFLGQKMFKG